MRLFIGPDIPNNPNTFTFVEWENFTIDQHRRQPVGFVEKYNKGKNEFDIVVYALENNRPVHPKQKKEKPKYIPAPGQNPPFKIKYKNGMHNPGNCPKKVRNVVKINQGPNIQEKIPIEDLRKLVDDLYLELDSSTMDEGECYDYIIRDGGKGPIIRTLLVDARDVSF